MPRPALPRWHATAIAATFLLFVSFMASTARLPAGILWIDLLASLISFAAYAIDKSAARHGRWRTQESTLHLLALIGGWPGALIAQNRLRHKSCKASFQRVFWTTVLANCSTVGWLLTVSGQYAIRSVPGSV